MPFIKSCLLLLFSFFAATTQYSLLDRVTHKDVRTSIPDFRTSDADVGMRSAHFIGSFRGEPIKTRQHHAFIDDNGVPIPLLPYHENFSGEKDQSSEVQNRKHHLAMARERQIHKWIKETGGIARR